jgi:integrase
VIIAEVLGIREHIIFRLATWEGMRPGEIVGLQLADFEGDSVWVRRRLTEAKRTILRTSVPPGRSLLQRLRKCYCMSGLIDHSSVAARRGHFHPKAEDRSGGTNLWRRYMAPKLEPLGLGRATFQVMRRTLASRSKQADVDAHTRSAQMGNTVDVNENEYAVASFEQKLAAVRRLETAVIRYSVTAQEALKASFSEIEAPERF